MSLMRWDPFSSLSRMHTEVDRLFEDFFGQTRGAQEGEFAIGAWAPTVDIYETDNEIIVTAELPGLEKEQVGVEYKDGVLTLRGERKLEREVKELRRANEILKLASAFFAQAELDRRLKS